MALPSRAKQVAEMEKFLNAMLDGEESVTDVAEKIVDGYHALLSAGIKAGIPPLHEGLAFKSPLTTHVHHVAWTDGERAWIVTAASRYGFFGPVDHPLWKYVEYTTAKTGAPGNNPDWKAGDLISRNQRRFRYEVIATGDKCVLLRDLESAVLTADTNENMKKHYQREKPDLWS